MKKVLILIFVPLMYLGIANACPGNCSVIWDNFHPGQVNDRNDHGGRTNCNPWESIHWNDNNSVTIKYLGRPNKKSNTCYVKTGKILAGKNGQPIPHGYLTADISFKADKADDYVWPAFWLSGDDPSGKKEWPASGEIDIAEHIYSNTLAHLIGYPDRKLVFNPKYMSELKWPDYIGLNTADKKNHAYGMEWKYKPDTKLTLIFYYDEAPIGELTATRWKNETETNVFNAFSKNWYEVIFDSDRNDSAWTASGKKNDPTPWLKSSITVSDVKVYEIK